MKPKSFAAFVAVTALVTIAALITVAQRYWTTPTTVSIQPFPGLIDHINDVTEIDIKSHDGTTILHRVGDHWTMATKNDYPVQQEAIRKTLIGFGELHFTEKKTADPKRYSRLGVQDVDVAGSQSHLVTLKNGEGKKLAELIVGRGKPNPTGGPNGLYVRLPGQAQSWLAGSAGFYVPENPVLWLHQRILHVNGKRVSRIEITQPNGEKLTLTKDSVDDAHFSFPDLKPDQNLKGENVADDMSQILMVLDLVDVAPKSEVQFPEGKTWKDRIETFDGLVVTVNVVERDGNPWATFHAEAVPLKGPLPKPKDTSYVFLEQPDAVKKEADEINSYTGKWAYELKPWQAEKMQRKLSMFLEVEHEPGGGLPPGAEQNTDSPPGVIPPNAIPFGGGELPPNAHEGPAPSGR